MERVKNSGFGLLSLIVALGILASLATAASGVLRARIETGRSEQAAVRIEQALHFARQAALLQGTPVAVCLDDGTGACAADGRGRGLRIHAGSGAQTLLQHLRLEETTGAGLRLRGAFGAPRLLFAADGSASLGGSIHYCPGNAKPALAKRISVSAGGHIRNRAGDLQDCR